ncbi:MAG: gliding motility-associated C-terminal domain-containing protein, partial [Dinghuibacter sp.]|nr:gliding motility-associated C-terminal domain-containing protein [Dinghuibacter sp.]
TGGEMIYDYLGPGANPGTSQYRITLFLFRDQNCVGCATMPANVFIGIVNNDNGTQVQGVPGPYWDVPNSNESGVAILPFPPCMTNPPTLSYNVARYTFVVTLPNNNNGYTASYQTCCRVNPLQNVFNTSGGGGTGSTYAATIPGLNQLGGGIDNSPRFFAGISVICKNKPFSINFSASDPDGDSLVYEYCPAYNGGGFTNSSNGNPSPPPYGSVNYINGFDFFTPLGNAAPINQTTGIISGIAPGVGKYVVCVCVKSYRNGVLLTEHRKDFIINVSDCDFAGAQLEPSYISCDGFTLNFTNLNTSPLNQTFYWDFGVSGIDTDTSTSPNPTYTYTDTGTYVVKLVVNRGLPCSDSTTTLARVYPGFFPGFRHTGACYTSPINFFDTTLTVYGATNYWHWDFGDNTATDDTSRLKNPSYTYPNPGIKTITLKVGSNLGCSKTYTKDITIIDKPTISVPFRDTLICSIDTLQLGATTSGGAISWTPNYNIINTTSLTPLVFPKVTTTYKINVNEQGCINNDSITVRVKDFVTVNIMPDTAICLSDSLQLRVNSDGLSFLWNNASTLSNPNIKEPFAKPVTSPTTYVLRANIGKCETRDSVTITGSPYPTVDAGPDTTICFGEATRLNGVVGGSSFTWTPVNALTNPNTLTPIARPVRTTAYVLTTAGFLLCPKPARDTVVVNVIPPIRAFAGNDTSVVIGQPLQLFATGSTNYEWSPAFGLNDALIQNPIARLNDNQTYIVRVFSDNGCFAYDTINITVFKTAPDIFVPTAFTPNGDGVNDILLPVPVGLKGYDFFEVYNRWGLRVFSTTQIGKGWDGTIRNRPQDSDTFVWVVQGTDFTGKRIFKKGTVVLIR